jgi:hypothetical protein
MSIRRHAWVLILLLILVTACGRRGEDSEPSVKILSPPDQHSIVLGETLQIESRARDDGGISAVELRINGIQVHTTDVPKGEKSFRTVQSWSPPDVGVYFITVIAYDNKEHASQSAGITITVEPAPTPTPSPTTSPHLHTPTPTNLVPSDCIYNATFVTDVTIPDNTQVVSGAEFVKTWRLRNSGTCDWGEGFQLAFVEGEQMGDLASVSVPLTPAGATADVTVRLQAPQEPGTYRGYWRMRAPDGREFGDRPFVQIVVFLPATPKPDLDITLASERFELLVGQPLTLPVAVRNHGPGATDRPALVRAVLRDDLKIERGVTTLPPGGEEAVLLSHTFDAPIELEALVSVDPDDEIAETDEANNTERVTVVVNPSLYATRTITMTPGLSFDLDDGADEADRLDVEWRVVEGTVSLNLLNDAGAASLSEEAESISYALVVGLAWDTERLMLADLAEGSFFGFRTSDDRVGYARVEAVLDATYTSVRLTYLVWDWP